MLQQVCSLMQQPQIIDKSELIFVGHESSFIHALSADANNLHVIGSLWDRFLHPARQVPHRDGNAMFGVITGRPESERKHPDELQYMAAVAVHSTIDIPAGMKSRTIPASTFAVFSHKGPMTNIGDTVGEIYRNWLPQSDYVHSEIGDIELYDHRFNSTSGDSEMEYWISISPKPTANERSEPQPPV